VKTAAETFASNPKLNVASVISQMGVGEALVSTLQEQAIPMPVERTLICPPRCRMGAIAPDERTAVRSRSPVGSKYDNRVNRESAYEILSKRKGAEAAPADAPSGHGKPQAEQSSGFGGALSEMLWGSKKRQGMVETMAKSTARTVGGQLGRQILRGVLGGIFGGSRKR
jgi:hypothetical protein